MSPQSCFILCVPGQSAAFLPNNAYRVVLKGIVAQKLRRARALFSSSLSILYFSQFTSPREDNVKGRLLCEETMASQQCDCSTSCQQRRCFQHCGYLAYICSPISLFSIHFLIKLHNLKLSSPSTQTTESKQIPHNRQQCIPPLSCLPSASAWPYLAVLLQCRSEPQPDVHSSPPFVARVMRAMIRE